MNIETKTLNKHYDNGLLYFTFPLFDKHGIKHAFTTRLGGVSEGQYSTFNASFLNGDNRDAVYENWRRLCHAIGLDEMRLIFSKQTHTKNVRTVTEADIGKGITKPLDYDDVDGLISDLADVGLVTQYADCVPLAFYDIKKRIAATSHAGWRGTTLEIGRVTVERMKSDFGCDTQDIIAAIGPSIDRCCYEVDEPVFSAFSKIAYINPDDIFDCKGNGKYMLNLREANRRILIHAGIREENIDVADICTCCNADILHSHRATGGKRGNLGLVISK